MERFLKLIRNKYLLAVIAFIVWMLFFDRYDVGTQIAYQGEKSKLEIEKAFYEAETQRIEKAIRDAQYNSSEIQRIAREKYKMKKENEDVYIVEEIVVDN